MSVRCLVDILKSKRKELLPASNDSIAMSLFSGSNADEVNEVLTEVPSLSGVLFGSSSSINIGNNLRFLEETK